MFSSSPRKGTWPERSDPWPQIESTLYWVHVAILHSPNACEFHNSLPSLLSPSIGWVANCCLYDTYLRLLLPPTAELLLLVTLNPLYEWTDIKKVSMTGSREKDLQGAGIKPRTTQAVLTT